MEWFNNLQIKYKLLLSFGVLLLITLNIGRSGYSGLNTLSENINTIGRKHLPGIQYLMRIEKGQMGIITGERGLINPRWMDPSIRNAQYNYIETNYNLLNSAWQEYERLQKNEKEQELWSRFKDACEQFNNEDQKVVDLSRKKDQLFNAGIASDDPRIQQIDEQVLNQSLVSRQAFLNSSKVIEELLAMNNQNAEETVNASIEDADGEKLQLLISLILGIICAVALGAFISSYMSKNIRLITERLHDLKETGVKAMTSASLLLADGIMEIKEHAKIEKLNLKTKDEIGTLAGDIDGIVDETSKALSSVDNAVSTIKSMVTESNRLVDAAVKGNLSAKGNAEEFKGAYRDLITGLNDTFAAVVKPINEAGAVMSRMAERDFTVRVTGDYSGDYSIIKNSINTVGEALCEAIGEVQMAVEAAASAAGEISSSSEEMASGAQEQSSQTTEIASAIEQMTKISFENTRNANTAAENSRIASDSARSGAGKVHDTQDGMRKIVEATKETGSRIASLTSKTDQIGEITQVIDDIADQTNLLALNAAIEAARAGEQGRGFAVVADEVRKLAERTTKATKEIADTIKSIQSEAKEADQAMNKTVGVVEEGMKLTEDVSSALNNILEVNDKVSDVAIQVAAGSEEQSAAVEEISRNVEGISSVTQQSAAGIEQIARAAEDLNNLTVNLQNLVSRFRINETMKSVEFRGQFAVRSNGKLVKR